jgi:hypothetical protein
MEPAAKLLVPPALVDGALSRIVSANGEASVETFGANGWTPGGATIASVLKAPSASPATLAELGAA